jgi:hypothetical protein
MEGAVNQYGQYKYALAKSVDDDIPAEAVGAGLMFRPERFDDLRNGGVTTRDVENVRAVLGAERGLLAEKGVHLFLDAETAKTMIHSVRKLSEPEMTTFVPDKSFGIVYVENEDPCLFMCTGCGDESYIRINMEKYGMFVSHATKGMPFDTNHDNMTPQEEGAMQGRMRMMYGMFMMLREFPEMLMDGVPDGIKHPAWYRRFKNKKRICINRVRSDAAPHIRNGHFRMLRSERFVHKRGLLVFVKATMVKGRAKHTEVETNHG